MHNGNDRDTKLNKASVGADFVSEAELREKFANEAKLAAERAEARAAEISYARSYRNKLERTKSAAEIKRKREKEEALKIQIEAEREKKRGELDAALSEIEKRRMLGVAFASGLQMRSLGAYGEENAEPKTEEKPAEKTEENLAEKSEKIDKMEGVSQNSAEIAPEIKIESKQKFTNKALAELKSGAGISIKIMPTLAPSGFFPPVYQENFAELQGKEGAEAMLFEGGEAPKPRAFHGGAASDLREENLKADSYFDTPEYDGGESGADDIKKGGAFLGGAVLGAGLSRNFSGYYRSAGANVKPSNPSFATEYSAPYELENLSDAVRFSQSYEPYTDVEHMHQGYEQYTDVEHIRQGYEPYTDVEHIRQGYEPYTDVDHAHQGYEQYTDVEHIRQGYEQYTDVDHAHQGYEPYTDVDHMHQGYEQYTDVDHAHQGYEPYTDVDHAHQGYEPYTDVEHIRQGYEPYTDVDHAQQGYDPYTDVEHIRQRYEPYTDVDHVHQGYEPYTDVDHMHQGYEPYTDVEHVHQGYEQYTDVEHVHQGYEQYTDVEHIRHGYEPYTDVEHVHQGYEQYTDVDHAQQGYEPYTDVEHVHQGYEQYTDVDHAHQGYEQYTDVDHAGVHFDTYTDYDGQGEYHGEDVGYGAISDDYGDVKAIAAYEAMRMRKGEVERRYSGYGLDSRAEENSAPAMEFFDESFPTELNFESYGEREMAKYLRESDRRVKDCERAIAKKERSIKKLSSEDKTRALLDSVNLNKHIVDLRAMALYAVVSSKDTKHKKQRKRLLGDAISKYNAALADYESRTGESFKKANLSLVADIVGGKTYTPLPLIKYFDEIDVNIGLQGEELSISEEAYATRRDKNREKLRFFREARREEKRIAGFAKGKTVSALGTGAKISEFQKKIDREVELIKVRNEALRLDAESRLDYLDYSFSASLKQKSAERRKLKEDIRKLKKTKNKSLKNARRDSDRYYSQLLVTAEGLGMTSRKNIDKLDSLNMQLDALLSERERINEQLIKLYSGDIRGVGDKKINQKIKKIKRKTAKRVSKRFRRDMRVLEKRVPLDIKEKLVKSANKIIDAELLVATLKFKLKRTKPRGEVRRDMKTKIRENRSAIKYYLSDYRRFLKRARAYAERSFGIKIQLVWIGFTLAVLVLLTVLYLRFEEPVNAFFGNLFSKMR